MLFSILFFLVLWALWSLGELTALSVGKTVTCEQQPTSPGVEDIAPDHGRGVLYLSADDRRGALAGESVQGKILVVTPPVSIPDPLLILDEVDEPISLGFHPHGIDFIEERGRGYLWVVNHRRGIRGTGLIGLDEGPNQSIELYEVDSLDRPTTLRRKKVFSHSTLTSPNDIVALSTSEFYVSIDHASTGGLGKLFEVISRRSWGGVLHYRDGQWEQVNQSTSFANGIELSADHKFLFLASANGDGLQVFKRSPSGSLAWLAGYPLSRSIDNLIWDAENDRLWMASHPRPFRFLLHAVTPYFASPSEGISAAFDPVTGELTEWRTEVGEGLPISGSSVIVPLKDQIWVGSVFEEFILRCD